MQHQMQSRDDGVDVLEREGEPPAEPGMTLTARRRPEPAAVRQPNTTTPKVKKTAARQEPIGGAGLSTYRHTVFHEPWWLEAVAPGRWQQVTIERGGRIVGSLPYAVERDGRFDTVQMPHLCHVLGPTVVVEGSKIESRQRSAVGIVGELLDLLPPSAQTVFTLDAGVPEALPYLVRNWKVGVQYTFLVDTARTEKELWGELRDKTRNLIRRSQERLQVVELTDFQAFAETYLANLGGAACYVDLEAAGRAHAAAKARDQGKVLAAVDQDGKIHAAVLYVWDAEACYYLLSTRDPASTDLGAVSIVLWNGITLARERGLTFDCDGVAGGSILQFFLGFGGRIAIRHMVLRASMAYRLFSFARQLPDRFSKRRDGGSARFAGYPG